MKIGKIKTNDWNILINKDIGNEIPKDFFLKTYENLNFVEILKNDNRSFVAVFLHCNKKMVLKIPKEKNRRKWIRFTTLFRKSESIRNFYEMEKIIDNNILTTTPLIAAEKRKNGMVIDSFIIYEYLSGEEINEKYYLNVIEKLKEIHKMGYIHGDSQRQNFLYCNGEIAIIDASFYRKKWGKFSEAYELWYLRKSGKNLEHYLKEESKEINFKIIELIQKMIYLLKNIKKKLKGFKKDERKKKNTIN